MPFLVFEWPGKIFSKKNNHSVKKQLASYDRKVIAYNDPKLCVGTTNVLLKNNVFLFILISAVLIRKQTDVDPTFTIFIRK